MKTFVFVGGLTSVQPLATCSKDLKDREGASDKPTPVPHTATAAGDRLYFPATGIRGKLRRCARNVIRQHLIETTGNKTPFTLDDHYFLTLGGIKGKGATEKSSVAHEAQWREKNPLLSVFGAGDAGFLGFVHGHLSVGNAVCQEPVRPALFNGARTDEFYRDSSQAQFLSEEDVASLVLRAQGNRDSSSVRGELKKAEMALRKSRRGADENQTASWQEKVDALTAEIADIKSNSGASDVSVGMPLAGYSAIPEGQFLEQRMHLLRSNDIELGLVLASLNAFALEPILGAHAASGCGLVSGRWAVYEVTNKGRELIGNVSFEPFDTLEIEGAALSVAVDAFHNALKGDVDFSVPKAEPKKTEVKNA